MPAQIGQHAPLALRAALLVAVAALTVAAACDPLPAASRAEEPAGPTPPPAAAPAADDRGDELGFVDDPGESDVDPTLAAHAKVLWDTRCAACHGPYGRGSGPAAAGLSPPPRDFHARAWQASAADAHIKRVILEGGGPSALSAAMPAMPANTELHDNPALLDQLVAILRGLPHWAPAPPSSIDRDGRPVAAPSPTTTPSPAPTRE